MVNNWDRIPFTTPAPRGRQGYKFFVQKVMEILGDICICGEDFLKPRINEALQSASNVLQGRIDVVNSYIGDPTNSPKTRTDHEEVIRVWKDAIDKMTYKMKNCYSNDELPTKWTYCKELPDC